jgi:hypothetical protein
VFGLAFARDIETVAAEESVGERFEATLGSTGAGLRYETEEQEGRIGRSDIESERQIGVDGSRQGQIEADSKKRTVKGEGNRSIYMADLTRRHPHNHIQLQI